MNEVKTPKKPLIFYYVMVFLLLMMLNFMAIPWMAERQVREVDYGTFMTMTEDKKIAKVEIDESEIVFTDKDGNIYKTGPMNDPDLVQRLHDSGAEFASQIVEQMSPFLSALLGWIVPIAIFMIIGQVYVQASDGQSRRRRERDDVRYGQVECQSIRKVFGGNQVHRRGRRG